MTNFDQSASCPFTLDRVPTIINTRDLPTPELVIEPHAISVELGDTALRLRKNTDSNLVLATGRWPGVPRSLGMVAAHLDAGSGLRRYEFEGAPYHAAAHFVDDAADTAPNYCTVHTHDDVAELNVIVPSKQGLTYAITDGNEEKLVQEPTVLWFPRSVEHCAMAKAGSGLFFVARLPLAR